MKPINFLKTPTKQQKKELYYWITLTTLIIGAMSIYWLFQLIFYLPKIIALNKDIKEIENSIQPMQVDILKLPMLEERRKKLETLTQSHKKQFCNPTDLACIIRQLSQLFPANSINSLIITKKKLELTISIHTFEQLLKIIHTLEEHSLLENVELTDLSQLSTNAVSKFQGKISAIIRL